MKKVGMEDKIEVTFKEINFKSQIKDMAMVDLNFVYFINKKNKVQYANLNC